MTSRAEVLFYELADLSPQERESYFARNEVPVELRQEVESLLRHDTGGSGSLTRRVAGGAQELLRDTAGDTGRCGPYRLIRVLGHGGMGAVYLARRADGEVEQQVAVKLLRFGSDEDSFRQRFLRERQILASLSHPGIARLVDAGHTREGQPYLVMDYINGVPIDEFAAKSDLREKLNLFVVVCDAVSHAHRNLIIHRDLKPSNILVDDSGQPKLLDFGIAKILDVPADQTRTRDRMLTPDYASPEQVRGTAQSTATDVYSLGAVLYKLLTGRPPHHFGSETKDDLELAICMRETLPPSRIKQDIPRDLDFVLMKALRKEPHERYVSVDALAADLRAFLECRPVQARSGTAWYRLRKFGRRYWLSIAAVLITVFGLSVGFFLANRERAIAERRFQQVRQLANRLFTIDADLVGVAGATKARLSLAATSKEYLEALAREARGDKELAYEIGVAYLSLAQIQGVPSQSNLGQMAEAEDSLQKAAAFLDPLLAESPDNPKLLIHVAEVEHSRMIIAESSRRNAEALKHAARAAQTTSDFMRSANLSPGEKRNAGRILSNVAQGYMNMHHFDEAAALVQKATGIGRSIDAPINLAHSLSLQANILRQTGHLEQALEAIQEAKQIFQKAVIASDQSRRLYQYATLLREGMILGAAEGISLDRTAEAAATFQSAFDLMDETSAKDPSDTMGRSRAGTAGRELCRLLRHTDPKRALAVCDQAVLRLREIRNNVKARRDEAEILAALSYSLRKLGRASEAGQRIESAFNILRETKDYPAAAVESGEAAYHVLRASADHFADLGQTGRAVQTYQELLEKVMLSKPDPLNDLRYASDISRIYESLSLLQRKIRDKQSADSLDAKRAELWRHWDNKLPQNSYVRRQLAKLNAQL